MPAHQFASQDLTHRVDAWVPAYVRDFQPYVPSKPDPWLMREYGVPFLHRLNNNENPLGPPPAARQAIADYPTAKLAIYPSGDAYDLRLALGERFGFAPDQFMVGNGSSEVITAIIKAFCEAGDNIITADKTFAVYEWVAQFSGIDARLVSLRDFAFDPQGMLDRMDARTKIIFVCNPNNPTGSYWSADVLTDFLARVDQRCVVVVDEAYFEYVAQADFPDAMTFIERFPNLVVFRTFSKMFALAGLRIGYMVASAPVAAAVRRTYTTYSVNNLAQLAAHAVLADSSDHVPRSRAMVYQARAFLQPILAQLGLTTVGGEGNYLMIQVPVNDALMYRRLMRRGFMVRAMTGFRYPGWIRLTLKEAPVMAEFAQIFCEEIVALRRAS